ncbi:similar to Saccharomyces cerevisiae YGL050W TYW3 tRNA methyltransferase required for synthesis of wybutosine [Maudiozyma saulgeensis]|uniref:tRNA wybutosine-synthesizing protein 3 n=1 Tax=Maudiozyma saulgeensis TaxID=1789683 RepID=A0A1X7R468_9SACH|nr:similar to Saccharomyces cerevisiae YGL050W TYW3 tRNA methyltransferase required for synthesis of wybutosine [Kazachstania saulgeensis]
MSQNAFDQKKASILDEINSPQPDLSPKGSIDELCIPIMELINSHKDMVTTSSCSGRVSVFVEGTKHYNEEIKVGGKGQGGRWLFVSHDETNVVGWLDRLEQDSMAENIIVNIGNVEDVSKFDGSHRYILYKYEPFILHVKCRDFDVASKLYNTAMDCGFRESGIGSNNLVAIRINIKLDVPIGYLDETSNQLILFVTEQYIKLLDNITLAKFNDNAKKINQLFNKIEHDIIKDSGIGSTMEKKLTETKEERRQRKRREGLERQELLNQANNNDL